MNTFLLCIRIFAKFHKNIYLAEHQQGMLSVCKDVCFCKMRNFVIYRYIILYKAYPLISVLEHRPFSPPRIVLINIESIPPQLFFRRSVLEICGKLYKNYARLSTFLNIIAGLKPQNPLWRVWLFHHFLKFLKNRSLKEPLLRNAFEIYIFYIWNWCVLLLPGTFLNACFSVQLICWNTS